MKQFLLINVSPRKNGTSAMLLNMCREHLAGKGHCTQMMHLYPHLGDLSEIVKAAEEADVIVFSGSCYVNTYPADAYALLQALAASKEALNGKQVYGIIQGGMPYAHTHESGLTALELFSRQCGLNYMGGFVMGMGAMLNGQPLEKLINGKKVAKQLNIFFDHMEKGEASPRQVYQAAQLRLPVIVWRFMARWMNKKIDRDLASRGIDVHQVSPYL